MHTHDVHQHVEEDVEDGGGGRDAGSGQGGTGRDPRLTQIINNMKAKLETLWPQGIDAKTKLRWINIDATVKLAQALTIPVIASGGLSNMADIEQLCAVQGEGVEGVICGRAIYSGNLDFQAAQARADELND